jgi:hypothetical protein
MPLRTEDKILTPQSRTLQPDRLSDVAPVIGAA